MTTKKIFRKYSKSSGFYRNTKSDFFEKNYELLEDSKLKNALYSEQPERLECKICGTSLTNDHDLFQHGVAYIMCSNCNHLNGRHEETKLFIEKLYINDAGMDYARNYLDPNFEQRSEDIYIPKIDFLIEVLGKEIDLLDVGCGSGYLGYAAIKRDIRNFQGLDVSNTMVNFGNRQIQALTDLSPLRTCDEIDFYTEIKNTQSNVISAIGVIEHLREPLKFFDSFKLSKAEYLFYSVPMFSVSVFFENIFPSIFPRHLSGGHTHLFSEESILEMNKLLDSHSIAEWRFGTDIMDLFRAIKLLIKENKSSERVERYLDERFMNIIDPLQSVLDMGHFTSELHVIVKKNSAPKL